MARADEKVKLGEKIRFFPYHACTCANLNDEIVGFRGERVEVVWAVQAVVPSFDNVAAIAPSFVVAPEVCS